MTRLLAASALVLATLTACGGGSDADQPKQPQPNVAACEQAMRQQFADAMSSGAKGERPAECKGVSDAELERIAGEIIGGALSTPVG